MHSSRKALLIRNAKQKGSQRFALFGGKRAQQSLLVLLGHPANLLQQLSALFRQVERVEPPVIRIGPTLHQPSFFEVVEDCHKPAGMNFELGRKFLLAQSGRDAEQAQNAGIRRRQPQNSQSFSELHRRVRSQLGKQERWPSIFWLIWIHLR